MQFHSQVSSKVSGDSFVRDSTSRVSQVNSNRSVRGSISKVSSNGTVRGSINNFNTDHCMYVRGSFSHVSR